MTQEELKNELKSIVDFHYYALMCLMSDLESLDTVAVPRLHWQMYKALESKAQGQNSGVLLVAPVGFAKSTIFKIWGLYQLLWRIDPYILYVSSTIEKAVDQFAGMTKVLLNPDTQTIFEYTVIKQNTEEIILQWKDGTKSKIDAIGSGKDISGINFEAQRPTLILVDDIEEIEQARNKARTDDLENWLTTTLFSRLPTIDTGRIRMIGTVFSKDSLANRILGNSDTYAKKTFNKWITYKFQALDEKHKSEWEERHPTKALLEMRELNPQSFAANYMNEPLDELLDGVYYASEIKKVLDEGRYGEHIRWNPNKTVDTWWDLAVSHDLNAVWFTQTQDDGTIHFIDYWEGTGLATRDITQIIQSKPYLYGTHFAPHDMHKKHAGETANRTLEQMYNSFGLHFAIQGKSSVESGRDAVRLLFPRFHFSANPEVAQGFNRLQAYRAREVRNSGLSEEVHDINSHCADALRLMAVTISVSEVNSYHTPRKTTLSRLIKVKV